MNLLITTDTVGGVWTFTVELAAAASRRGARVTVAAMGGGLTRWFPIGTTATRTSCAAS